LIWYFIFFFLSGFCSVLYELVWLRLSMAEFGVTTAMVSIVLSVFMGGLGLGSWASGEWIRRRRDRLSFPALRLYAGIEFLIGVSAILVPYELEAGRNILEKLGSTSSVEYYLVSGIWVAIALIPWCTLMGATIPVAMLAIESMLPQESSRSFSYLYMANVIGALFGTTIPLFFIEISGFHGTLQVGAACNCVIALLAVDVSMRAAKRKLSAEIVQSATEPATTGSADNTLLAVLFFTGLTSMGMEVVWVRQFTPFVGTVVYAFASILAIYLAATFLGSRVYRHWSARYSKENDLLWIMLALFALLPLVAANPKLELSRLLRLSFGIAPFAGMLGFVTPMLVDRWSGGNAAKAGKAYAINVLGCIIGPLLAGFLLLPFISERWSLLLLSLPWLVLAVRAVISPTRSQGWTPSIVSYASLALVAGILLSSKSYEQLYSKNSEVLRDSTATVIATGTGMQKQLLINGYTMTSLTPITKMMAHLPLASLDHPPQDALVVCFGMGTTFRSLRSWGIPVTVVELVPSVPRLFGFFHKDAAEVLDSPLSHVVVDDGRRYLERTDKQYDVITIDPPPPVEAAGSSLLYSEDFYAIVRQRLRPGGLFQQWLPYGDAQDFTAVARALRDTFPYVRVFAYHRSWGFHFLASEQPLHEWTAKDLVQHMPPAAITDMMEWGPGTDPEAVFAHLMQNELQIDQLITMSPQTPALSDDRPVNEYYLFRSSIRQR
jgi:spermidine synthase